MHILLNLPVVDGALGAVVGAGAADGAGAALGAVVGALTSAWEITATAVALPDKEQLTVKIRVPLRLPRVIDPVAVPALESVKFDWEGVCPGNSVTN